MGTLIMVGKWCLKNWRLMLLITLLAVITIQTLRVKGLKTDFKNLQIQSETKINQLNQDILRVSTNLRDCERGKNSIIAQYNGMMKSKKEMEKMLKRIQNMKPMPGGENVTPEETIDVYNAMVDKWNAGWVLSGAGDPHPPAGPLLDTGTPGI